MDASSFAPAREHSEGMHIKSSGVLSAIEPTVVMSFANANNWTTSFVGYPREPFVTRPRS